MSIVTNLLTQVANLAGTATDADAVETWLLDGARQISKFGKMSDKMGEFTKTSAEFLNGSTASASVDDLGEIVEVTRGGGSQAIKVCRYVGHNEWQKASDTSSIFYENSADNPIYSILPSGTHSTLYVSPAPAATTGLVNIKYIPEYSIDSNDNIDYFPRKYYHLCIYYAAIKELGRKLKDATITTPSLPVSPASPSFTYSEGDLSISNVVPVAPIISENLASISGTAPTYTPPVFNIEDAPTISNLVISVIPPVMPASSNISGKTIGEITIPTLPTAPAYTPPVMGYLDWTDTESWISTEEDPEMLAARINEIQAKITEFNTQLNNSQAEFNKNASVYQAAVQKNLEQARIWMQDEHKEKDMEFQADVQNYTNNLQRYANELSSYQAQVNKEVQEWQLNYEADMAVWNQENGLKLQKFQTDIQNATNVFNEEQAEYQAKLQIDLQNPQLKESKAGRDLQKYSQELQSYGADVNTQVQQYTVNLQNATNAFQKDLQEYQSELAKYQGDLGKYQAELGANVQTYQAEVAGLQIKLQQCQAMYQEAIQLEFQISLQADILDKQGA